MSGFNTIQQKLEQFIKKYYTNELLKGIILFFTIGLLYFLITLLIEFFLWLNPTARTVLFWLFIGVEMSLFVKFIAIPLAKLFKFQKGIDYQTASKIIGNHFPQVKDKLLNVLQLNQSQSQSELLLASIEQKSNELQPIPFKLAINFKKNAKYLKYAAIPTLVLLLSSITGNFSWFSDSYNRVVNYQTAYEPPAPFQFFVVNEDLKTTESENFKILVKTFGALIPENAQIHYNNQSFYLQQTAPGQFEYVFLQPKIAIDFNLSANQVSSKRYKLNVIKAPTLVNFEMILDYPSYIKKKDEIIKSTGNATLPEGTTVTWKAHTKTTNSVTLYANDTTQFEPVDDNNFKTTKRLFNHFNYSINTSNANLKDYESLAFSIRVIKDNYPELNLKVETDSIDNQSLYFYGQVSDDYGLRKLQLVYYPSGNESEKSIEILPISSSTFDEFVSAFPNQLNLKEGVNYELYFQVFDNDALHNFKSVKSNVFTYRKLTKDEEEQKQLENQKETIKDLSNSFEKFKAQDKQLEELSKLQKEKKELNFNDRQKLENFLKRQKQQEEMMQNFNKNLKENLENFQRENEEQDTFKEELKERLKDNENQLKKDEKLLEELEKLKEKINKEELSEKLEKLAKQNKNKHKSLEQLLELTKRYYVSKKLEKLQQDLEKLAEEQNQLSNKEEENTKEKQEEENKKFEDFQKEMDELQKENEALKKPMDLPQDKGAEEDIKKEQQEATDQLQEKEDNQDKGDQKSAKESQKSAQKKQKSAAKKMKQMSSEMAQSMEMSGGEQISEDVEMLRQILDNLVLFSFDQEALMKRFKSIEINHNNYSKYLRKQSNLRTHFEHIDDSLFALSLRQPIISEVINSEITNVFFNIDKSTSELSENQLYKGVSSQQYTVTAANTLASFLNDILDSMEMQMNSSSGECSSGKPGEGKSGGNGEGQLPDIIMSQEALNKQMQKGLQKGGKQSGEKGEKEGEKGENGKKDGEKDGQKGQKGKQQGEGEGISNEELNGELYSIYQQQQQLRQQLENKLGKKGLSGDAKQLLKDMEEVELDLINKGFTNQTLQKMLRLKHRLLKLENATFTQDQDNKRKSETNTKDYINNTNNAIPAAKEYFNTTEILNRHALPLQQVYKKKVQEYFKNGDD